MTGRARGVVLIPVAIALAATVIGARLLAPRGGEETGGPTYLAYRVAPGQPLAFPVDPGERDLAVTVQVAAPDEPDALSGFQLAAELRDPARRSLWRGASVLEAPAGGTVTEGGAPVSAPRTLRIAVPGAAASELLLTVDGAGGARPEFAVLRVVRRRERASLGPAPEATPSRARQLGERGSIFGWPYLDEAAHQVLLGEPLRRRAASDKRGDGAELVHVQLTPRRRPAPPVEPPGELVAPDAAVAYTARGPGRLRLNLRAERGGVTAATVRAADSAGRATVLPVPILGKGTDVLLVVPDGGALTVAVEQPRAPVRVRAFASGGARRLGDPPAEVARVPALGGTTPVSIVTPVATAVAPPGPLPSVRPAGSPQPGEHELDVDRRTTVLWRVHPAGPPALASLVGDGAARVEARPVTPGARLRWRLVAGGATLRSGVLPIGTGPSLYERMRPGGDAVEPPAAGEPLTFVASGPVGATLELSAVGGAVDLALYAEDEGAESKLAPAYEVPLENARLRHAPRVRRRHAPFLPDNHRALAASAGRVLLEGQVRLEPAGPRVLPAGPFRTVDPLPPRTRQLLVERDADGGRWGFATGEETTLFVDGRGRDAGRLVLDYRFGPEALGGTAQLFVDGAPVEERVINLTRGKMRVTGLAPGAHPVAVVGPPGLVLTGARGEGAGAAWAERAVWRLDRGSALTVPMRLGHRETARLNVVLYGDAPLADVPELSVLVEIDGGAHGPGVRLGGNTDLTQTLRVPMVAVKASWLDRQRGPLARARFAVTLGPDLGAGVHRVRVSVPDGPERLHARFFRTGSAADAPASFSVTEWAVD
jgi:hypothetical protein